MTTDGNRNTALLIDADNASHAGIDAVLTVMAELGEVNIRRAYGNWRKQALKGWVDKLHLYGIEPQQQFDMTKGKNATDMKMTIDAMDMLFGGRVNGFGIMSSDSDFMPLAMRLRQDGYPVYGFGSAKTPEAFKAACTRFIDVDALMRKDTPRGDKPARSGEAKAPNGTQERGQVDDKLIGLLVDAYNASDRDERGFANMSQVGQRAGNRSSFDVRNYGFSRLSDLFEAVPNFQTERRDGNQLWVKRLR